MSVAHGTAQPGSSSGRPRTIAWSDVEARGPDHAARGGQQRHRRLARRRQRAARERRLDDLLRRQREEEHHADVVDGEVQRVREPVVGLVRRGSPRAAPRRCRPRAAASCR